MLVPSAGAAQDASTPPFRSACDLVDAQTVSGILGDTVTADEAIAAITCSFSKADTEEVVLELIPNQTLPVLRLTLPSATYAAVGDRAALVSPGDSSQPAGTIVALDDGLLQVQVTSDAPGDQEAESTAIATAILSGGPVLAQPPSAPGLVPLTFDGSPCDLVTAKDLKQGLGSKFTAVTNDAKLCAYASVTRRGQEYVSVAMPKMPISMLRTKKTSDVTIAGRPGLLVPKMGTLLVDIGDGRAFELGVTVSPKPKGSAARKLTQKVEDLAAQAIGRMTPSTASAAPTAGGPCALLSHDAILAATGMDLPHVGALGETACSLTSADQRTGVLVSLIKADDLDASWADARQSLPLPEAPTSTTVDGQPAYDALVGTDAAAVAVDLAGTPNGAGTVLGLVLMADPAAPGDPLGAALSVADLAVKASTGS